MRDARTTPMRVLNLGRSAAIQAKYVKQSPDSDKTVPGKVLEELEKMMEAAASEGGKASPSTTLMDTLSEFDKEFKKTKTKVNNQDTFGVGASSFFPGVSTFVSVGSGGYESSVNTSALGQPAKQLGQSTPIKLGPRDACTHGEVAIVSAYPGVQGVVTTQDACIFCYGLLCSRGYQHQALRANPWPQKWTHDYLGFKLHIQGAQAPVNGKAIVEISWGVQTRYYWVELL